MSAFIQSFKDFSQLIMQLLLCFITGMTLAVSAFGITLDDKGRTHATVVSEIVQVHTKEDILKAIRKAQCVKLPVSIMATRHSQGGQTLAAQAIALDMLSFNRILNIDVRKRQITVQSGITWVEIQRAIQTHHLALSAMQSPNFFSVGGSLSVNAHGDDFRAGSVGNRIVSFHLMLADGTEILVTPKTRPDVWKAVIGGYGLLGVVTDVTVQLTDNHLLAAHYDHLSIEYFPEYFKRKILSNPDTELFYARLSIVPDAGFLQDMYSITYTNTQTFPKEITPLNNPEQKEKIVAPIFNASRYGAMGKKARWEIEKRFFRKKSDGLIVSRNEAMNEPNQFAADYHHLKNADWLQEYFIPVDQFPEFIRNLRTIMLKNAVNLLNATVRYVPAKTDVILSYADTNCLSVVLYFNQDLSADAIETTRTWTVQLIEKALALGGKYYLTYQNFARKDQFERAYPRYVEIRPLKKRYDPQNLFTSQFFQTYF